jgi:Sec-independent protein translocase protein TatA
MDFLGVGGFELLFILVLAIIVLGPARMVDLARNLGGYWREAQRVLRETADAATVKLDQPLRLDGEDQKDVPRPKDSVPSSKDSEGTAGEASQRG